MSTVSSDNLKDGRSEDRIATLEDFQELFAQVLVQLHRLTFVKSSEEARQKCRLHAELNLLANGLEAFAGRASLSRGQF